MTRQEKKNVISKAYVICTSHRSREKVHRLVGEGNHEEYYNFGVSYHLTEIPESFLKEALEITGIRKGKFSDEWMKCWKSDLAPLGESK